MENGSFDDGMQDSGADFAKEVARFAAKKAFEKLLLKNVKLFLLQVALFFGIFIIAVIVVYGAALYLEEMSKDIWNDVATRNNGIKTEDFASYYYNEARYILQGIEQGTIPIDNDMAMLSRDDMVMILKYVIQYNDDLLFSTTPERIRYQYEETRQESKVTYKRVEEPESSEPPKKEDSPPGAHSEEPLHKAKIRQASLTAGAKYYIPVLPPELVDPPPTSAPVMTPEPTTPPVKPQTPGDKNEFQGEYIPVYSYEWGKTEKKYAFETVSYQTFGQNYYNPYSGENSFALPWQTIMVLCEMVAENNYDQLGSDEDGWHSQNYESYVNDYSFETSMDGYFVTDAQVIAICEILSFRFETYKVEDGKDYVELTRKLIETGGAHYGGGITRGNRDYEEPNELIWGLDYSIPEMRQNTYRLVDDYIEGDEDNGTAVRLENLRIPAIAPYGISNAYTLVTYGYTSVTGDSDEAGASYCSSMQITMDARRFVNQVKTMVPDFTWEHFLELLEMMPNSEDELNKYRKLRDLYQRGQEMEALYQQGLASGVSSGISERDVEKAYQSSVTLSSGFEGYHTYVGAGAEQRVDTGVDFKGGENAVWIGTHYEDGRPASAPREDFYTDYQASYNNWFHVQDNALVSLAHSDGLKKEDIETIVDFIADEWISNRRLRNLFTHDTVIDALYDWQESRDASITGVLAIMQIEGAANGRNGTDRWNFFNIKGNNGWEDFKSPALDRNGRDENLAFADALITQMNRICTNYLKAGQDTYFKMQFGRDFSSPIAGQEYYEIAETGMAHCYCPWYQDYSFPFSAGDGTFLSGKGWCNNCGDSREVLLNQAGYTVGSIYRWPVPEYTRVSSEYGSRVSPTAGASSYHRGMDIAAPAGSAILAIYDGTVTDKGYNSSSGYYVTITHTGSVIKSTYMHMSGPALVEKGDNITKGQQIGCVGTTGISTGNHLHISITVIELQKTVDPRNYLTEPGK